MKIFHLISHFDMGGAERVAASIAKSQSHDMEYHVMEMMRGRSKYTKAFITELEASGVVCHRSWMPDVRFHFLFERLAALLFPFWFLPVYLKHKPDVIHAHTEGPDMCIVLFFKLFPCLRKKCRIVRTIHNTRLWTGQAKIGRRVEVFYQKYGVNVAISQGVAKHYSDTYGGKSPIIIHNGVEKVPQERYGGLVEGKVNILFSGRFEQQKGISALIHIIKCVPHDSIYHFHIFGDGSLKGDIEMSLSGFANVSINPPLFGLSSYLSSFDYMLMPSEFEGLSIVAIEASMAGLPNIISDIAGLRETVPDDWVLKASVSGGNNDVSDAFVDLLMNIIPSSSVDKALAFRKSLSERAHAHAIQHFSVETMQKGYEDVYLM